MIEGVLIAIGAGLLVLTFVSFRSFGLLAQLRGVLPDRGLVERLQQSQEAMTRSIDSQRRAVEEMPGNVAVSLALEVKPLAESLERSHDHFSRAVLTLDQDGNLAEWVGGIREAVEPLRAASSAVERHYQLGAQVLQTTSALVEQWAVQREAVVLAFQRFADSVERSSAAEITHLRDIEHRVMNRLEEVAETNANVAQSLSELQTASRLSAETQTGLGRSVEATVLRTGELIDLGRQTQVQLAELIRSQLAAQQDLGRWQKDADQALDRLRAGVEQVAEANSQGLELSRQQADQAISGLQKLLGEFHQRHGEALAGLQARHEAVARREEEIHREQKELIGEVRGLLQTLPVRRQQTLSAVLVGLQVALTAAILIRLLAG